MQWENLTAPDFASAVMKSEGACLLPLACIEKHGDHLPLGADLFLGMEVARRAAELEPAVVFPPFDFTQILEAKHQPGTIALGGGHMLALLEAVCDEIARNGLNKIVLLIAHGGNRHLASFFVQLMLDKQKDYMVYLPQLMSDTERQELMSDLMESDLDYHAGEMETSILLATHAEFVKMDRISDQSGSVWGRLRCLPDVDTPVSWYADSPDHFAGDAHPATADKGERILTHWAERLGQAIAAMKRDEVAPRLYGEFFSRTQH